MNYLKSSIIGVMLLGVACLLAPAQTLSRSVIGSTGSVNELLSYTVGETVIETGSSGTLILTQGFQQPDKLIGTFSDPILGHASFTLYPNPASERLMLEIQTNQPRFLQIQISDIRGRQMSPVKRIETGLGTPHSFDVNSFASGTYLLLIKNEQGTLLKGLRFVKMD